MGKKHKGTSRPPATERAFVFWAEPCNAEASRILEPKIAELRRTDTRWRGVHYSSLIAELYSDPTTVPRWERKETGEDGRRLAAFEKMCDLLARAVEADYPGRQINVALPKGHRRAESRTEARDQGRRDRRDEEFGDLALLVEKTMEGLGVGASAAVGIVADRNGVSVRKVYEARAHSRETA